MRLLVLAALVAAPALAGPPTAVRADYNSHWLDYKTDLSEARRELRKDLRDADSYSDRVRAYDEYQRELADARADYRKEMAERGLAAGPLGRPTVQVIED